jgi:hypothetical protein
MHFEINLLPLPILLLEAEAGEAGSAEDDAECGKTCDGDDLTSLDNCKSVAE